MRQPDAVSGFGLGEIMSVGGKKGILVILPVCEDEGVKAVRDEVHQPGLLAGNPGRGSLFKKVGVAFLTLFVWEHAVKFGC